MERARRLLNHYETVAHFSEQMLDAARHGQWETLTDLEHKRSAVLAELLADTDNSEIPGAMAAQVASLIGVIQGMDAETRSLAESWRDELRELLGSMGTERKLSQTYGP